MVYIGSARKDEHGKYSGGAKGDQLQKVDEDYKGEVSQQEFYVHNKGWYVFRAKDTKVARGIANSMRRACNNTNVGYSQSDRLSILLNGTDSTLPTNCDCSSLIRQCIKEASGKDVGNFNTESEYKVLKNSKLFEEPFAYRDGVELATGDVLVTKTKGHTVAVTSGIPFLKNYKDTNNVSRVTLRYGSKGKDVLYLHAQLKKLRYGVNDKSNYFDSTTKLCVQNFQACHSLDPDGVCGPLTWKEIEKI